MTNDIPAAGCGVTRWRVVDCTGQTVFGSMYRRENAQSEADRLNEEGLPEFRPYSVDRDHQAGGGAHLTVRSCDFPERTDTR